MRVLAISFCNGALRVLAAIRRYRYKDLMKDAAPALILVVEDDREIADLLAGLLRREGYVVALATSGQAVDDHLAQHGMPALVVLDLMLPGEDGFSVCRRLRIQGDVPILMLTAKNDDIDRIVGLELGADDYLGKPFNPRELLARLRAILRRVAPLTSCAHIAGESFHFADYTLDVGARRLLRADSSEVPLLTGDFELLQVFVERPQRVLSRDQLMDWLKGRSWDAFDRSIDVAVSRLRRKIEPVPAQPSLIKTVRNGGYLFAVPVQRL